MSEHHCATLLNTIHLLRVCDGLLIVFYTHLLYLLIHCFVFIGLCDHFHSSNYLFTEAEDIFFTHR